MVIGVQRSRSHLKAPMTLHSFLHHLGEVFINQVIGGQCPNCSYSILPIFAICILFLSRLSEIKIQGRIIKVPWLYVLLHRYYAFCSNYVVFCYLSHRRSKVKVTIKSCPITSHSVLHHFGEFFIKYVIFGYLGQLESKV